MNRSEFEHAVRAAGAVVGAQEILVIGSQAVHASLDAIPEVALRSVEADIAVPGDIDGEKADLVDGSIGEASLFHETFGFYVQGVTIDAAILPPGWQDRLIRFESPATTGVVAWCLSLEDLWVSKALAGRPKDLEFCRALIDSAAVDESTLRLLLDSTDVPDAKRHLAYSLLPAAGIRNM